MTHSLSVTFRRSNRNAIHYLTHYGRKTLALLAGLLIAGATAYADSPWETAVNALQVSFTGPIARGLSLVAVVVGGLMFAFGEADSKRTIAGIVFGLGMAISAVNFMSWLFPG